jgi:hypothetical protein
MQFPSSALLAIFLRFITAACAVFTASQRSFYQRVAQEPFTANANAAVTTGTFVGVEFEPFPTVFEPPNAAVTH